MICRNIPCRIVFLFRTLHRTFYKIISVIFALSIGLWSTYIGPADLSLSLTLSLTLFLALSLSLLLLWKFFHLHTSAYALQNYQNNMLSLLTVRFPLSLELCIPSSTNNIPYKTIFLPLFALSFFLRSLHMYFFLFFIPLALSCCLHMICIFLIHTL